MLQMYFIVNEDFQSKDKHNDVFKVLNYLIAYNYPHTGLRVFNKPKFIQLQSKRKGRHLQLKKYN